MHIKLGYIYFSALDLEVKVTEILKCILLFSEEKHGQFTTFYGNISHGSCFMACHRKLVCEPNSSGVFETPPPTGLFNIVLGL